MILLLSDSKAGCKTCGKVLDELEKIDDEAQQEGIHIVKIDDINFAKKHRVFAFPAILFFRGVDSEPIIYAGKKFQTFLISLIMHM